MSEINKSSVLGGEQVVVSFKDGTTETVTVREVTAREVLDETYFDLLHKGYECLIDWICGKAPADKADGSWSERLTRDSWKLLRETEERLNFTFALDEMKAAISRGQRSEFIRQEARRIAEETLKSAKILALAHQPSPASLPDISVPQEAGVVKLSTKR